MTVVREQAVLCRLDEASVCAAAAVRASGALQAAADQTAAAKRSDPMGVSVMVATAAREAAAAAGVAFEAVRCCSRCHAATLAEDTSAMSRLPELLQSTLARVSAAQGAAAALRRDASAAGSRFPAAAEAVATLHRLAVAALMDASAALQADTPVPSTTPEDGQGAWGSDAWQALLQSPAMLLATGGDATPESAAVAAAARAVQEARATLVSVQRVVGLMRAAVPLAGGSGFDAQQREGDGDGDGDALLVALEHALELLGSTRATLMTQPMVTQGSGGTAAAAGGDVSPEVARSMERRLAAEAAARAVREAAAATDAAHSALEDELTVGDRGWGWAAQVPEGVRGGTAAAAAQALRLVMGTALRRLADADGCAAFAVQALDSNAASSRDGGGADARFPEAAVVAAQDRLREALEQAAGAKEVMVILSRLSVDVDTPVRSASSGTLAALQVRERSLNVASI